VGRERLRELLAAGRLPGVSALVCHGTIVDITVTDHCTDTRAGHTEMLTGYGPDVTGVHSNIRFGPIPAGLSVFEALHRQFGPDRLATIMVTTKAGNLGSVGRGFLWRRRPWRLVRPTPNAIAAELDALAVARTTMVFVTADHGFDPARRRHRHAPLVFLATNHPGVVRSGDQRDIVPILLAEMGADSAALQPQRLGRPLTSAGSA
jgi:hypothetical protein